MNDMSWGIDQDGNLRRLRVDEEGRMVISCYLPAWETPVETVGDLPDDPAGTVRVVLSEPGLYIKSETGWEKVGVSTFLSLSDTPESYNGQKNKILAVSTDEKGITFIDLETGAKTFIELTDVPNSYDDQGGKYLRVKEDGGIEFVDDIPSDYENQAGKYLRVKTTEDGLEFADLETGALTFIELADVPESYAGNAGKYLRVNATADGLEFATIEGGGGGGEPSYLTDDFGGM